MSKVLLCVSSSISCELFYKIQQDLEKDNEVKVIFTEHAIEMLKEYFLDFFEYKPINSSDKAVTFYEVVYNPDKDWGKGFKYRSYNERIKKYSVCFPADHNIPGGFSHESYIYKKSKTVEHIELIEWADKLVIAPCTANLMGKICNGIADDFITTTIMAYIGTGKPMFIAPAMNTHMWENIFVQENILKLKSKTNCTFISPTVKKLACGDLGFGALAYTGTIVNIVNDHRWILPIDFYNLNNYSDSMLPVYDSYCDTKKFSFNYFIPTYKEPGSFGFKRKFEIHNGVDIYCAENSPVHAVEDGEVIAIKQFTGKQLKMDWWLDTWAICIKGKSGVVCYGEMNQEFNYNIGEQVKAGDILGTVKAVLPAEKIRKDIRNHNNAMLHIQLFKDYENDDQLLNWYPNKERNKMLLDPTPYLNLIN